MIVITTRGCSALSASQRRDHFEPGSLVGAWLLANSTWKEGGTTAIPAAAGLLIYLGYRTTRYDHERRNSVEQ